MPVFLAIGAGALDYAGFGVLTAASLEAAREASVPVAVHLDHSPDVATLARCVGAGFTSVMIDGHRLPFEGNVALTREAVEAAGGVAVEAELGGVPGAEDASGAQVHDIPMTDPDEASRFVEATSVESLAIAIGNAHGVYSGEPHLDFGRLAAAAGRGERAAGAARRVGYLRRRHAAVRRAGRAQDQREYGDPAGVLRVAWALRLRALRAMT